MSYKIEKEGFEMYGFKLGQMTKQGRVIGFDENDTNCGIAVECNNASLDVIRSVNMTIVLDGCEDCEYEWVNKNLIEIIEQPKISIRHAIWNTTLIVQTLHCEPFDINKDGFVLIYSDSTRLCKNYAYIGYREGNTDTYHFDTQAKAQSYLDTLLELVEMVNNPVPVVDLDETQSTNLGKYMLYINPNIVELADENDKTVYWCDKVITLPIIKQQLEQILAHLNVKCEVVI